MSKENVKKFFSEIEKDAELKEKYSDTMKAFSKESETIFEQKLMKLGKDAGFNFTADELFEAHKEIMDEAHENGELDLNDLKNAAGGIDESDKLGMYTSRSSCPRTLIRHHCW